jgi:hypothetical protein
MEWQQLVSLMIVATAAFGLLWSKFHRRKFSLARDTHCGCAATSRMAPQHSIIYRARKGQRPEVRLKLR